MYLAPMASKVLMSLNINILKKNSEIQQTKDVYRQINDNDYIYVSSFDTKSKVGMNFTYEHFEGNELKYKIFADNIRYIEKDSTYRLISYVKTYF